MNKKGQEGGIFFIILIVLVAVFYWYFIYPEPLPGECVIQIRETPIYSLVLSSEINGVFILGTGSFGKDIYYYYYIKDSDGGKILDKYDAEWIRIVEDDYSFPAFIKYKDAENNKCPDLNVPRPALRVPTNTIKKIYNVDLNNI